MPLTTILTTDLVSASRAVINDNFTYLDTKTSLAAATAGITAGVATGLVQINNGTSGKWAGLDVGSISMKSLATPTAPTITMGGATGATTYSYTVAALLADGTTTTAASSAGSTTTGNATLSATNYNIITWPAVTGATSYNVFRTAGGATQGKIISATTAVTGNDTGLAASGAAPTVNGTGSLLWATDGGGSIGAGVNRPLDILVKRNIIADGAVYAGTAQVIQWYGRSAMLGGTDGVIQFTTNAQNGFTRLQFGLTTNSAPALANGTLNGFAIQSAAGTSTFNDAVTAQDATVAMRNIFLIDTPTLTGTATGLTYTKATALRLGIPTASTNITIGTAFSLIADGPVDASKYYIGGVVGYNGVITLLGTTTITVAYGIITGIS